jgi:hypothetical protein
MKKRKARDGKKRITKRVVALRLKKFAKRYGFKSILTLPPRYRAGPP